MNLAVDPISSHPIVAYGDLALRGPQSGDGAFHGRLTVLEWNGNEWNPIGVRGLTDGESYAGVLAPTRAGLAPSTPTAHRSRRAQVPTVALKLLAARNAANAATAPYSLEGFALGNSCPGNRVYTSLSPRNFTSRSL